MRKKSSNVVVNFNTALAGGNVGVSLVFDWAAGGNLGGPIVFDGAE
eukprot:CAMPEP_0113577166 /NCGR_PEP_ID=MMETSP0015_2-20120614/28724_1 /TAXON_ID=2838 /ORGANISM="Odontella" /LENGTH=45 /DNA_ID=CAMNT_0000480729 /DNA_START=13 /DNA_END=150 /DNA_ORIENTATION=- /assembly_acc=CAM_ASM_000160